MTHPSVPTQSAPREPYRWPDPRRVFGEERPAGELYLSQGDGKTCPACRVASSTLAERCPCGTALR